MPAPDRSADNKNEEIADWLSGLIQTVQLIEKLGQSLSSLQQKRQTLEEKMIAQYLYGTAAVYGTIIAQISSALKEKTLPAEDLLGRLRETNTKVDSAVGDLLKSIGYNPNYLEQYFEYGFLTRLTEEYRFNEVLEGLSADLSAPR